ncbi:rRNA maturation RNase YbeY [Elusimicrobiota bacterium]
MSKKSEVNYIGDDTYLDKEKVTDIAHIVIGNYWKFKERPPERFKLDINVVTDNEIREINKEYLKRDRPTDVIAFSLNEGEEVPEADIPLIGQIVISKDAAQRQAGDYNHSVSDEMAVLLIHGLLHVAGWEEGEEIQECQKKIKEQL